MSVSAKRKSPVQVAALCGAVGLAASQTMSLGQLAFATPTSFAPSAAHAAQVLGKQNTSRAGKPVSTASHVATAAVASLAAAGCAQRRRCLERRATKVETESKTGSLAPWEIDEETEDERQARYAREADEMKLKWDARRLEERQSAQRRQAFAQKEQERSSLYGPRDLIMDAYEARMYEESRVIEVRRSQREVHERIKAHKAGKPLPPKGNMFVPLKPAPVRPAAPEVFDVSGHYKPQEDIEAGKYKAPYSYVSPTGPAPPERHQRGTPRAAWENPPYTSPNPNTPPPGKYPDPGSLPESSVPPVREQIEKSRAERKTRRRRDPEDDEEGKDEDDDVKVIEEAKPVPAPAATAKPAAAVEAKAPAAAAKAPAASGDLPSESAVKGMTVPALKTACEAAGLATTGKKADLQERLVAAIKG
ncbi:unnamed protein product [Polarella glacialis]|uniref:SAP domain-containing protein n=1 Tax=Polarella glacialis TaxID=89957 RepID=A0A813FFB6_POLGL|nr:unnamed protein product [Polarella glacialis]